MLQKDEREGSRTWKSQRRRTEGRLYGIEERESKVESPVWLEGERQLVTVANTVLAPISNPFGSSWLCAPTPFFPKATLWQFLNSVYYNTSSPASFSHLIIPACFPLYEIPHLERTYFFPTASSLLSLLA